MRDDFSIHPWHEARRIALRGKRSVGIGGHISMKDSAPNGTGNAYSEGMSRELAEEVSIETPYREHVSGSSTTTKPRGASPLGNRPSLQCGTACRTGAGERNR